MGEHEIIKHKIAAKILLKSSIKSKDLEEKVKREIRYSKYFKHPNIIRLYEVIETNSEIILIMEYASGGELYDLISNGNLTEVEARKIFQQIIFGLEYIHSHQVTHRDLKPENILFDEDGNVKIADFGLSNVMRDGIFLYTFCGSPNYAAPELISGKFYTGTSVDIWSCGVILFAMLTGTLPFDEDHMPKLYEKIKEGKYNLPTFLSEEGKELITEMLQVNPSNRISIDQIKNHPWFKKDLKNYKTIDNSFHIFNNRISPNQEIINEMVGYGIDFEAEELIKEIKNKEINENSVIYDMLNKVTERREIREKEIKLDNEKNYFKLNTLSEKQVSSLKKLRNKFTKDSINQRDNNNSSIYRDINYWSIGLTCKNDCYFILLQILRCLDNLGYEWKLISSSYKIKCRRKDDYININENESISHQNYLNIFIQIFKIPDRKEEYTVDLHCLSGSNMEFLDFCSDFLNKMNVTECNVNQF